MIDEPVAVEFKTPPTPAEKLIPLLLSILLFVIDQITKLLIVRFIPPYTIGASFFGDFLRIIHVTNPGIAFSLGNALPGGARHLLFALAPLGVIVLVLVVYFRSKDLSTLQRWAIAGIIGGGLGNIFDRFFRKQGVVDFIDVKFYGLFGLERWPTFNVADMSVLISGFILILSFAVAIVKENARRKKQK
jgi:signal peptidase II